MGALMPDPLAHLIHRAVDRLILSPTRHKIPAADRVSLRVPHASGELELWHRSGDMAAEVAVLAFPGTGSRAEDSESLIAEVWPSSNVDVWWVNPPGYGGSPGVARLRNLAGMAEAALDAVRQRVGDAPILAEGYSLGTVAALHLAAINRVDGVLLRNPPALHQILQYRGGWWSLGLIPALLSRGLPRETDSIRNAARSSVPALFVTAMQDHVVPASIQYRVIEGYAGPSRVVKQPGGDHNTPLSGAELEQLRSAARWFRGRVLEQHTSTDTGG